MPVINTTNVTIDLAQAGCPSCTAHITGVNDEVTTDINTPVNINVLSNDILNGQPVTITNMTQPSHGELVLEADGTVTYTPSNAYTGTVTSTITITSDSGETSTEILTIHVGSDKNDIVYTAMNTPVQSDVMYNDAGIDDIDNYSISTVTIRDYNNGDLGTAAIAENEGSNGRDAVNFTPPTGYKGPVLIDITFVNGADTYTTVLVVHVACENCSNSTYGFVTTRRDGDNIGNMAASFYDKEILSRSCGQNLERDLANYDIDFAFSLEDSINIDASSVTSSYRDDINRYDVSGKVDDMNYVLEDGAELAKLAFKATVTHCNGSKFIVLCYLLMNQNIEREINDDWEVLVTNEDTTYQAGITNNRVSNIDLAVKSIAYEHCSSTINVGDAIRNLTYTVTPEQGFVGDAKMTIVWEDAQHNEYPEVFNYDVGCGGIPHNVANDVAYRNEATRQTTSVTAVNDANHMYEINMVFNNYTLNKPFGNASMKYNQFTYEIEREFEDNLGYFDNLSHEEVEVIEDAGGRPVLRAKVKIASLSGGCPTRADGQGGNLTILRYKVKMTPCNGGPTVYAHFPCVVGGIETYTPTTETYVTNVGETLTIPDVLENDHYGYSEFIVHGVVQAYNGNFVRVNNSTVRYVSDSSFVGVEEVSIIIQAKPCYTLLTKKIKIDVREN